MADLSSMTEATGRWEAPGGWSWHFLLEVTTCRPELGDAFAQRRYISETGDTPLIQSGDVGKSKEVSPVNKISLQTAERAKGSHLKLFTGKQLLVTVGRETMGQAGILNTDQQVAINNAVVVISPDEDRILLDFLYYYFLMKLTRSYLKERVVPEQNYASPDSIAEVEVIVPPISVQRRILQRIEALSQGIKRSRDLLATIQADTEAAFRQAVIDIFAPEEVNTWPGRVELSELLDEHINQSLLTYENVCTQLSQSPLKSNLVLPNFVVWALLAHSFGEPRRKNATSSENLSRILLPFPNKDAQQYIANRLDAIRSGRDAMQQQYKQDLQRLDELEQNILERAFQGRV
jgi:restriction endonuclease S subunit